MSRRMTTAAARRNGRLLHHELRRDRWHVVRGGQFIRVVRVLDRSTLQQDLLLVQDGRPSQHEEKGCKHEADESRHDDQSLESQESTYRSRQNRA